MNIYLIGSLRNEKIPGVAEAIRNETGHEVFDDWFAAGPEADDYWQNYEKSRGRTYAEALEGHAAGHVFQFDCHHLMRSDAAILVLPAGKSAHLEFGWMRGSGKMGLIYFADGEPERWDVMYQFADRCFFDIESLVYFLRNSI